MHPFVSYIKNLHMNYINMHTYIYYIYIVDRCSELEVDIFSDEQTNSVELNVEAMIYT